MTRNRTRRALLSRGTLALAGVAALAGCTSDGGGDTPDPTDSPTATADPTDSPTATATPGDASADRTVLVGPGGSLVFDPAEPSVGPGDTVLFSWESNFHTVTVESQPDGAGWSGTGETTHDEGFTHTHTFEMEGTYEYYCNPHRSSGMVGTIQVGSGGGGDSTPTATSGGDQPY